MLGQLRCLPTSSMSTQEQHSREKHSSLFSESQTYWINFSLCLPYPPEPNMIALIEQSARRTKIF